MSNDRKEPTFSPISQDEAAAPPSTRERVSAPGGSGTDKAQQTATTQRKRPQPVSSPLIKTSPLIPLALLLALTGLGLAAVSYWQLLIAQQQVSLAEKRIASLEGRLQLSDSESTQSVTVLQASLRETKDSLELAHNEIRKLWDTRNVNKKAIAANERQLVALQKTADSASASANAAKKLAEEQQKASRTLSSNLALQAEQLALFSDQSTAQQRNVTQMMELSAKLEADLKQLRTQLNTRVKSNEEAIQAIDGFRRQVNREILEMKQRLGAAYP